MDADAVPQLRPVFLSAVKAFDEYTPVPIEGKLLSETVIEERR